MTLSTRRSQGAFRTSVLLEHLEHDCVTPRSRNGTRSSISGLFWNRKKSPPNREFHRGESPTKERNRLTQIKIKLVP